MEKRKFKILRVTVTEDYFIEMLDNERTEINGWTMDEVVEDWFKRHGVGAYHASREYHHIGNSKKYIKHEIIDPEKDKQ